MDYRLDNNKSSQDIAFILYHPKAGKKEQLSYNERVGSLISYSALDLGSICSSWCDVLEKILEERKGGDGEGAEIVFIDTLISGKRHYMVKGTCVTASDSPKEKQYIFMIERFNQDKVNLPHIFRKWKLTNREQEIVRLLIDDHCNKEIADVLNLSIHTVKSYVKLLSAKVGVSGRAGLVGRLLSES